MNIGALLDLGVPLEHLEQELAKLGLSENYKLVVSRKTKMGITKMGIEGTKFDVVLIEHDDHHHHDHQDHHHQDHHHVHNAHNHENDHEHAPHSHSHDHSHEHTHHEHRGFTDIKHIIEHSTLSSTVKERAIAMFYELAVAEAKVHGKSVDEVHFHEVGAIDAIVDIVGAAICYEYLQVDAVYSLAPEVGSGFVKCAHGLMPVPAPATAALLAGAPFTQRLRGEATTPTGATILKYFVREYTRPESFIIEKIGYGLGTKDFSQPNVLRVYLGTVQTQSLKHERQYMIETNIDDQNPEFYGEVEANLFKAGALDVYRTPIYMKKGRLGVKLSVLFAAENEEAIMDVLFTQTTTIGLRKVAVDKVMLQRQFTQIDTPWGKITVKQAFYQGRLVNQKPEFDELISLANTHGMSAKTLYAKILPLLEGKYE